MVRWTTLILFLAVFTVTTNSLRVFPESIRLFFRLYRAVARGGRILRDIAEGAGTVSEAIKSIDDLLDRTIDDSPVKEKLDVTPSPELPKKSTTTNAVSQTEKPRAKKKGSLKPVLVDQIVVTQHVSDETIVRKEDILKGTPVAQKKVPTNAIDEMVDQAGTPSAKKSKKTASMETLVVTKPVSIKESVLSKDDSVLPSPETKKKGPATPTCQISSSSSSDESCPGPTTSEPPEANLPLPSGGSYTTAKPENNTQLPLPTSKPLGTDLSSPPAGSSATTKPEEGPQPPSLNGCGALELHIKAPHLPVNKMTRCCDAHDACYIGACKANKRVCDNMLRGCLFSICEDNAIKTAPGNLPIYCNAAAKLLFSGTMALSFHQYKEAQDQLKC